jgi:hypothetical protein
VNTSSGDSGSTDDATAGGKSKESDGDGNTTKERGRLSSRDIEEGWNTRDGEALSE